MHLAERTFRIVNHDVIPEGYRLQDWSSNWTMQTLGLEDMAPFGPKALWYDHVYPPLLDAIRYGLMTLFGGVTEQGPPYIQVDFALYALYAVCFGVTNAIIYLWVRDLTGSGWWALAATTVWAVSPGYITVMQLLEPSPLAVTFITAMLYFLYRFLRTRRFGYVTGFLLATLLASLTRSVTQPHVLVVIVVATVSFWFMATRRSWWTALGAAVLVGLLFVMPIKQYVMFGSTDATTHAGYHRAGMLWIDPRTVAEPAYPQHIVDNALVWSSRFNTQESVKDNYRLTAAANELVLTHPIDAANGLWRSLGVTVPKILSPTSMYTQNYFVEKIPWRAPFDWLNSGWRSLLLLFGSMIAFVLLRGRRSAWRTVRSYAWFIVFYALLAAPVLWSNRYYPGREDEGPIWAEADRLKLFLEIPFYVFLTYVGWLGVQRLRGRPDTVGSAGIEAEGAGNGGEGGASVPAGLSG
jgi:hypothetical protein